MGNSLACFRLNSTDVKRKSTQWDQAGGFQSSYEGKNRLFSFFPVGSMKGKVASVGFSTVDEVKTSQDWCLDVAPTDKRSATTVHIRAKNRKLLPQPLKIEENNRYAGEVPILLSEFTVRVPDFLYDNGTTTLPHKNLKRQRSSLQHGSRNVSTVPVVAVSNEPSQMENVQVVGILRQRSFSLDNAERVLYQSKGRVDKGRWRKYLKYSEAAKNCLDTLEYRRNTLDCPSSLEKSNSEASKYSRTLQVIESGPNENTRVMASESSNSSLQPSTLFHHATKVTESSFATNITYEDDPDSDQFLEERECICDNLEKTSVNE